jgi:hypothetical protein
MQVFLFLLHGACAFAAGWSFDENVPLAVALFGLAVLCGMLGMTL